MGETTVLLRGTTTRPTEGSSQGEQAQLHPRQVNQCVQNPCAHGLDSLMLSCRAPPCTRCVCMYVVLSLCAIEVMRMSAGATRGTGSTHVDVGDSVGPYAIDTGQQYCSEYPIGAPREISTKSITFNSEAHSQASHRAPPGAPQGTGRAPPPGPPLPGRAGSRCASLHRHHRPCVRPRPRFPQKRSPL